MQWTLTTRQKRRNVVLHLVGEDELRRSAYCHVLATLYGLTTPTAKSHDTTFGHGEDVEEFVYAFSA